LRCRERKRARTRVIEKRALERKKKVEIQEGGAKVKTKLGIAW